MFRTLTLLSAVAGAVAAAAQEWWTAGILVVVALGSFSVFAERRFAATKELYQAYRRLVEAGTPKRVIAEPR
jgi:hypothetical protein